ncbi:hypothetical protein [Jeongeupia sp. USM3]|uniref:hypothetical protein n=1 Tax=Jeongeupia sp. USM3 TaxID=1906741 RepID=UPI00143AAE2A|nr:hypothetical protein [Jeongeupia sp. USM3]
MRSISAALSRSSAGSTPATPGSAGADWDAEFAEPADRARFYIVGQRGNTLLLDTSPPQP